MRRLARALLIVALLGLLPTPSAVLADTESNTQVDWYVVASGGGASSGGPFLVQGTIAQPAVAVLRGGGFQLTGGFWQASGAPELPLRLYLPVVLKAH